MKAWLPLALALVLNAGENVLLKIGAKTTSPLAEDASMWAKVANFLNAATVIGIFLFAANVIAYRKALDGLSISVAYPVMVPLGLLLVTLAAVMLPILDERASAWKISGMVLIGLGVCLVARG